jgi:hypothetical protein
MGRIEFGLLEPAQKRGMADSDRAGCLLDVLLGKKGDDRPASRMTTTKTITTTITKTLRRRPEPSPALWAGVAQGSPSGHR